MPKFAIIGLGYIAPRHIQAIKDVGGDLVAVFDISDSVGILGRWFPDCEYFSSHDDFVNYLVSNPVDFVTVLTPNFLHKGHIKTGMYTGADVICEKPLVIDPKDLEDIDANTIMQLRLSPEIKDLELGYNHKVKLHYVAPRGKWYEGTWKSREECSGGIGFNIGIHGFDLLHYLLGRSDTHTIKMCNERMISGVIEFEKGDAEYFISTDGEQERSLDIDGTKIVLTNYPYLHTESYKEILKGKGFKKKDVATSIKLAYDTRKQLRRRSVSLWR